MRGTTPIAAALLAVLPALAAPASLGPRERAGKSIYTRGESPSGGGISAVVGGDAVLPASAVPCAGCHGGDGLGRPEGGADPGVVRWSHLAKRYGHVHANGRRHPAFDARSFARAIREGVDPAGNALDPAMPRYSMSSDDLASLVAYLKVVERDADPGVSERAVRVGTVLPTKGRLSGLGAALRGVLEGAFAAANERGGVHGRRLVLAVAEYDPDRESGAGAAARLLRGGDVLALVATFAPAAEEEIAALAAREAVPVVGPLTPLTRAADPPNPQVFYVAAGLREQGRALARWAQETLGLAPGAIAVVHAEEPALAEAAAAARADLAARGAAAAPVVGFGRGAGGEPAARLLAEGARAVLFLGDDADLAAFARAAAAAGEAPHLLLSGTLSARSALELPAAYQGKVHLAYGTLPSDETPAGAARLADARRRGKAGDAHPAAQAQAFTAAAVLAEGLRRTGRHLTRERLVESLEALYRLESGVAPPVTFGPGRRVGARGAYVVALDLATRSFRPVSGWIAVE